MKILFTKQAKKDMATMRSVKQVAKKAAALLDIIAQNPFQNPPPYEKLSGELQNMYSRRLNKQHRLVYSVIENEVWVWSMWTHYENN